jgi:hypothetical protein
MGSVAHLEAVRITVGVDTHRDEHVAVALDALGKKMATTSMPTPPGGTGTCLPGRRASGRSRPGVSRARDPTERGSPAT